MQTIGIFGIYHACHPQNRNHILAIFPTKKYLTLTTWRSRPALPLSVSRFLGRALTFLGRDRETFLGFSAGTEKCFSVSRSRVVISAPCPEIVPSHTYKSDSNT